MKNKKGFTLVELLAVILILAILLAIAVPAVHKFLLKGSKTYYESLEKTVLLAGRDYFNDYRSVLPKEIGNVTVLEDKDIVDNHYIDKVVDKNNKECEIKVTAKKVEKGKFEYYSCIICEDYQSDIENCQHTEDQNITKESKDYRVEVSPDFYTVEQGDSFSLPFGVAYYKEKDKEEVEVSNKVAAIPRTVDTSALGIKKIVYWYHGAKKEVTVEVVDNKKPSKPQVVMRENSKQGKKYNSTSGGSPIWFSGNIYQEFQSNDIVKQGVVGSGIDYYEVDTGTGFTRISGNTLIASNNGSYTYKVRSVDKSGNVSDVSQYSFYIDKDSPVCGIDISGTKGENGWYISNVSLNFNSVSTYDRPKTSPATPNSNIGSKTMTISTTATTPNTNIYSITNSPLVLQYNSAAISVLGTVYDNSKNSNGSYNASSCYVIDNRVEVRTIKIDKKTPEKPTIAATDQNGSGSWHPGDTNGQVTLAVSGASSTSGISYYIDSDLNKINAVKNRTNQTATPARNSITISQSTSSTGTIYYAIACNGAGKCSEVASYLLKLDNVKPQCTADGSGKWHSANFTISCTQTTTNSSGTTIYYGTATNPTNPTSTAAPTIKSNTSKDGTKYSIKIVSGAGKSSEVPYIAKLDKDSPTITVPLEIVAGSSVPSTNSHFTVKYSVSGGTLECNPAKIDSLRRESVHCTATGGNGKTATASTTFIYRFPATISGCKNGGVLSGSQCQFTSNAAVCGTENTCQPGCDSGYNLNATKTECSKTETTSPSCTVNKTCSRKVCYYYSAGDGGYISSTVYDETQFAEFEADCGYKGGTICSTDPKAAACWTSQQRSECGTTTATGSTCGNSGTCSSGYTKVDNSTCSKSVKGTYYSCKTGNSASPKSCTKSDSQYFIYTCSGGASLINGTTTCSY